MLEAALFPLKLTCYCLSLTFVLNFVLDTDPNLVPGMHSSSVSGSVKVVVPAGAYLQINATKMNVLQHINQKVLNGIITNLTGTQIIATLNNLF